MNINFPSIISHLGTGSYVVNRKDTPTYVKGRLQPYTSTSFTITASVQPLTGNDMRLLPEGARADNTKSLFTPTKLKTTGDAGPDVVVINSEDYEVFNVESWIGFGESYFRTLIKRVS